MRQSSPAHRVVKAGGEGRSGRGEDNGGMPVPPQPHRFRRYVAVGDSFTEGMSDEHPDRAGVYVGWADRLADRLARDAAAAQEEFGYANLAVRGRRLADIAGSQVDAALELVPDLVSIVGGGNDLLRGRVDVDELADLLEQAVTRLTASGARVVMATPVDPVAAPLLGRARGRYATYAAHTWSIARRHDAVVVDLWGVRALRDARLWAPDRIHMTTEGHRRVAASAYTALGFPAEEDWTTPLPPAPRIPRAHRVVAHARWARHHLAPWVGRRVRGASSGDSVTAKRPAVLPLD
jgi:lysophospholipase L1-like esterase